MKWHVWIIRMFSFVLRLVFQEGEGWLFSTIFPCVFAKKAQFVPFSLYNRWVRIEVWFAVKFSQHLWIYLCENILISYFQFLRVFLRYWNNYQIQKNFIFQGKSTRRISSEGRLVLEGVFQKKNFFRERPPQKEWGGFQRGVKPPKNLCKFNSIMPANAKHACKCRKQCHEDKYRAILQRILKVSMLFAFQTWPFLLLKKLLITSIFLFF